ncbi:MAG: flavin reductase family protein [Bacteroidota bacterium]|nr:flavin reductase family protein [Bacteroidota bacterium]MDX5428500.1 flavin reductase family protein [Bacteroidota bacterium]MDX5449362.1 flavin reductase family protein [Bacteroidota bacterium]MDX5506257.1 flavin reductase family protein [Bacteroidota bacterium]
MLTIDPKELEVPVLHQYLLGAIGPRPIALASTMDEEGAPNLSPFSFFNVFGANPPIAIFSPARRGRDNTTKDTFENVKRTREVVINVVNYAMVQQVSLASTEYPTGTNEFIKSGLTPIGSETIKPFRVKESPVQMECKVMDIIETGQEGGAGNLVICEVVKMHIDPRVLDENNTIDQQKIDLVGRLGKNWYVRASGDALFEVEKPLRTLGIGVDQIPKRIRESYILTGNDLGMLGNVEKLPSDEEVIAFSDHPRIQEIFNQTNDGMERRELLHQYAKEQLEKGKVMKAWKALLTDKLNKQ